MTRDPTTTLIEWFQARPAGATLRWGDGGITADHPYATRGADPVIPNCPVRWPWCVVGPDEASRDDAACQKTLVLDYDLDVYEVWPGGLCDGPIGSWVAGRDRPLDVVAARSVTELRALPGAMLAMEGGWWPSSISRVLAEWTAREAGRSDVRFRWHADTWSSILIRRRPYHKVANSSSLCDCVVLRPAPPIDSVDDASERQKQRLARRELRIAEARRWIRRRAVDPTLAWLTLAEVRMLADLGTAENIPDWAKQHHVAISTADGISPVFEASRVLSLAQRDV